MNNDVILFDVLVVPEYTGKVLGTGSEFADLYLFDEKYNVSSTPYKSEYFACYVSKDIWHNRLGHPANQVLNLLKGSLNLNHIKHDLPCEVCHKAKQSREPFPLSETKSTILGQLIHLDVWGPYKVVSREGFRYFLTIVDDYSRSVWVYMLKTKDEVFQMFVSFYKLVLTQFDKKVKIVRSDNGTEFTNHKMSEFFNEMGILHQTTCAYTPQQNGIAERKHRHLLNVARSLMFQGGIPLRFWSECVLTAVYLINRLPSSVLNGKSPFSIVYNREPNLSHLRSFGCLCYATIVKETDKFSNKSEKCVLIGYASDKKAYKILSLENRNVFYSRDVKFYETIFPYKMNKSDNFEKDFVSSLNKSCEPSSFEEASKDVNWINAMNNEMHALYENNTWELVDLLYGRKPIGSRWVYKIKYMSTGEIERYKARVVAKGYNQKEGIDYEETFSPVVKMSTVRCLVDLAVQRDWKLYQMDVNNAFLYGDLYEDVYMIPPPGFMDKSDNRVCKLKRSLYDLKQAPRQWNHKLYDTLLEAGFEQSKNDHSLYIKNDNDVSLFLLVYVDDLVITGNSEVEIAILKTKTGLCLNQRKYCMELLHEFGLLACRPVVAPLPENISHFNLALRLLRYLKLAPGSGIDFSKDNSGIQVVAYSDSDWAKCPMTRRAMAATTCEVMWVVKILKDLGLKDLLPVELHCDNKAAIQIVKKLSTFFVREKVASGLVDTKCQVADIFTKALGFFSA
ncbi:retrovirus-related pol polyprotein from transposon TNT 1-94 [Tanacetum coccineum]